MRRSTSEPVGRRQPEEAEAGDHHHHRHEDDRDRDQGGPELAVDHRVAVDGLRDESRERALGPFAVHRIEREGDPEQGRGEADEGGHREVQPEDREVLRTDDEHRDEDRLRAARILGEVADPLGGDEQGNAAARPRIANRR